MEKQEQIIFLKLKIKAFESSKKAEEDREALAQMQKQKIKMQNDKAYQKMIEELAALENS